MASNGPGSYVLELLLTWLDSRVAVSKKALFRPEPFLHHPVENRPVRAVGVAVDETRPIGWLR